MDKRDNFDDSYEDGDYIPFRGFSFFGHPPRDFDRHGDLGFSGNKDDSQNPSGYGGPFPEGFPFSLGGSVNDIFKHFDEMFKAFGLADFPPIDIPQVEESSSGKAESSSARDEMLRNPDRDDHLEQPMPFGDAKKPLSWFEKLNLGRAPLFIPPAADNDTSDTSKEDSDLDSVVQEGETGRLFGGRSSTQQPHQRSYFRSVSVRTSRKPDGSIETVRTETDSKGNVTTTFTKCQEDVHGIGGTGPRRPGTGWSWWSSGPEIWERPDGSSLYKKFFGSWFK